MMTLCSGNRSVRGPGLLAAMFLALTFCMASMAQAEQPANRGRTVVMISVDGLAGFYMDDPRAKMPTIRALASAGAWSRMKAAAPTVTWPNHTNLVTGCTTARHGVVGNEYFDRDERKQVPLILDPLFDKEQIVRAPTVYDAAHAAGLTTAAVRWPASRNAKSLTWTVPEVGSNELLHRHTTPALLSECKAAGIWADGEVIRSGQKELQIITDETCVRVFNHILRAHKPNLALLHLTHVDHVQHVSGPRTPEAYAAIEHADAQVREIWEILKRDFAGNATLLIVSDHGFSPIQHVILPNVALRDAGLVRIEQEKAVAGDAYVVIQGGAAMVYVLDRGKRQETIAQVRKIFSTVDGVGKIAGPEQLQEHGVADSSIDPHAPDLILFAKEGYAFGDKATGSAVLTDESPLKGTHGHDENLPNLHATFVAWGAGIKSGARPGLIDNIDVTPTIVKLLNVNLGDTEGKAIAAALAD